MKKRLSVAIIGCGWAGYRHARAFLARGADLRWAIDVDSTRAERLAALSPETRAADNYESVLRDEELDAVDICLPHNMHAECAVSAARHKKHVLCEKPLAVSLDEADRMIAAAEEAGVVLMVAENEVFSPLYRQVRDLMKAGAIGSPVLVQMSRGCYLEESFKKERPWFLDDKMAGGGMMMSGGVHDFEKLRMIVGDITAVYARRAPQRFASMQGDDTSVALLRFSGGAIGIMIQSYLMKNALTASGTEEHTLRIEGEGGSIRAAGTYGGTIKLFRDKVGDSILSALSSESEIIIPEADTFELEVAHFIDCVRSAKEPVTSGKKMRPGLQLVLAAYQSMKEDREITLA